jgi:hypothetical protein
MRMSLPSNDVRNDSARRCTAEPDSPMGEGVTSEMWTTLHQPQEDVLGRQLSISHVLVQIVGWTYMEVDTNGDEKTGKG